MSLKHRRKVELILFFLILIPISLSSNYDFSENFDNFIAVDNCGRTSNNKFYNSDWYINYTTLQFLNNWKCMFYTGSAIEGYAGSIDKRLNLTLGGTAVDGGRIAVRYDLINPLTDFTGAVFNMTHTTTGDSDYSLFMVLRHDNGSEMAAIELGNTEGKAVGNGCSDYPVELLANVSCCDHLDYNGIFASGESEFTFQEIINNCENITDSKLQGISSFDIIARRQGEYFNMYIDNLSISNLTKNELPSFNFSISTDDCYNKSVTGDTIVVNLDINATDPEGDTLYYSLKANQEDIFEVGQFDSSELQAESCRVISFFGLFDIFEVCAGDDLGFFQVDSILTNTIPSYKTFSSCRILSNYSEFYIDSQVNKDSEVKDMLFHNPQCDLRKESFLDLKKNLGYLDSFRYGTHLYLLNQNNNTFNITFYNSIFPEIVVVRNMFVLNGSMLDIYEVNSSSNNLKMSVDVSSLSVGINKHFYTEYLYNSTSNTYMLSCCTENSTNFTGEGYQNTGTLSKFIGISIPGVTGNMLWQENFIYGGTTLSPEFTTTLPQEVTLYSPGLQHLTLYVTDSVHVSRNEFSYKSTQTNIPLCKYSSKYIKDPRVSSKFDILGLLKYFVGDPNRAFLDTADPGDGALVYVLSVAWVILFCMVTLGDYKVTNTISFTPALIGSSIIMLLVSFLLSEYVFMGAMILLTALGLAGPVTSHFKQSNGGRG